jgi:hypothetical protein
MYSAMRPRLILLACGTLALTVYAWTATLAGNAPQPLGTLLHTAWLAGTIALLLLAACARHLHTPTIPSLGYRLTSRALVVLLALACAGSISLGIITASGITRANPRYSSDAAAFNHFNAQLALHGVNPYTADARFWHAIGQFPDVGATPLRAGRYAGSAYGPSLDQIVLDVQQELAHPAERGPEYDPATLHSYPALAFLIYLPNVWAGFPSTAPTGLLFVVLFALAAAWGAPRDLRFYLLLILLANEFLLLGALRGSFGFIAYLPAIIAWRTMNRRWLSPALLGLACAVKQVVWPLAPLYAIIIWRRSGPRAALQQLAVALAAFLLPNLPFIIASPAAWAQSLLLPLTLPLFPSGVGLIELTHTGLLPLWPPAVYAALEVAALAALYLWYARAKTPPRPELALLLSLLPLLLAWRSLLDYFIVLPVLAVYAALPLLRAETASSQAQEKPAPESHLA